MHIDSFFTIGSTHRVCQDYSIHDDKQVILCDGCSGAVYSDVGARILAHSILHDKCKDWTAVINRADDAANYLGLPRDSLAATILRIQVEGENVVVEMIGDGAIFSRRKDGGEEIFNLEFVSGAPYYLRYNLDMKDRYLEEFGEEYKINGEPQVNGFFTDYPDGIITKKFPLKDFDLVAIFSDGLNSFQKKENTSTSVNINPYPQEEVLKEVMAIKGFAGSFVQRRCRKAFDLFYKNDIQNIDDFSMGVIKL